MKAAYKPTPRRRTHTGHRYKKIIAPTSTRREEYWDRRRGETVPVTGGTLAALEQKLAALNP